MKENRLKIIREDLGGISQAKLAKRTGIPLYKIAYAETTATKISHEIAEILSEKFNYNITWILTGEGPMKKQESSPQEPLSESPQHEEGSQKQQSPTIVGTYQSEFRVSEALTMCARVLESGTSYATALYLNIQHFDRAVAAESRIATVEKTLAENETRHREFEIKVREEINALRKEVNRLKATYEGPDGGNCSLTNTEKKAM